MDSFNEAWDVICEYCKQHITQIAYNTWISKIKPVNMDFAEGKAILMVPAEFHRQTLLRGYMQLLNDAFASVFGEGIEIVVTVPDEVITPVKENAENIVDADYEFTFDTFIVGSSNKFAHAASLAVATNPGHAYNPLFIYGNSGLGKTHLLYAIRNEIQKNDSKKKVIYVKGEDFTNELIDSIRNGNNSAMSKFREKYRNIDVLLIDDIQFIIGKESTQEEFFHTFEALYGQKKQIIISSDKPPKDLDILEERIRSRLEMGLIADIAVPDYETRMAILRKKEEIDGYRIDDEVLDYIAKNIKSNIRELEGCLNRVRAKSVLEKREINLVLAQEILQDLITPADNRIVTSEMIISSVAEHYHLTANQLKSQTRKRDHVYPRMIAMYLCRELTDDALTTIAAKLGKKDHSTVIHAIKKLDSDMKSDPSVRNDVELLKKKISPM